ncbi:MAG: gliding motility-associated C-terminal domain-containing protein [Bacteroidota bacterium]|nr:gliding motility-associated C-terminal domain-containing protein [Bacteroidota bacterium]
MKKLLFSIFILFAFISNKAQNDDCVDAIPLCTNPSFTFNANSGPGNVIDFTTSSNVSNPQTNPNPPNSGCLLSGELKPQWLILTVGNAGSLEFVFGASSSANPQAGFYDWAMWPYTPSSCSQIFNNTLPPIRCNWNGTSTGGTGMASVANIPAGGDPSNYEAPLAVNACQQFIICISNFSGVNTLVSFQSIGSASLSCNPNCNPSYAVCPGATIAVMPVNFANLTNPTFSLIPGPLVNTTGTFVLTPSVSTQYTTYITGTNSSNAVQTISATLNVTVHPKPFTSPLVMNASCSNIVTNSVNLNVTFNPSGSPNYTTTWSPMPSTVTTVNSGTAAGLTPGVNTVTITTSNGCTNIATFTVAPIPLPASFTVVNPSGDYTITCLNTNVLLTASVTNGVPLTFTWFPTCTGTVSGASMNFTQSCTGQVVGTSSTGCQFAQTYTVYQNFTSPTIAITPTVNNITCSGGSGCFTLTSNLGPNVTTNWFQIMGTSTVYVGAAQGTINIFCAGSPGAYWGESVNNLTGCKSTKSVQVTASVGVPIFTVTSPTNFTIGCASKSITSMQVTTVITSPVLNTPVNYTFMIPPVTSTPTTFTTNPNLNNIIVPGTYVIFVKDITNNCISSQSISIIQNTIAPNVDFIQPLSLLTCREPSMVLNGISSNPNTQITWTVPAIPSNSINPTPNHTVTINPAITGATNNVSSVGIFTVGAVDQNNMCSSTKTVQILQDIRLPKFTISALTNSVITCKNPDVVIVPIITPTLAVALVPTYIWYPPVGPGVAGSQFNSTAAGSHTAISTSVVNGCTTSATYIIAIDVTPPAISAALPFTLDCNVNPTASLMPTITGTTTGFTYSWTVPAGALTSNLTSSLLVTNKSGLYRVLVTNTLNGCAAQESYSVVNGVLNADFTPSSIFGFAPLTVNFLNTSSTSTGASSILCLWSYGNGIATPTTILNTVDPVTTYTAAGTYTVVLLAKKGSCVDSSMKIIRVEIPSKMDIPNVFTPNGDKVNDVFRLIASSLKEVSITIFDRWGNKVYELASETGNFGWDGKNQYGKECATGTYFYIIKATGKDGLDFDQKGNVSLFR